MNKLILAIIILGLFLGLVGLIYAIIAPMGLYDEKPYPYSVSLVDPSAAEALYSDWTTTDAIKATTPSKNITSTDHGTKTINGIKVYYMISEEQYMVNYDDEFHYRVTGSLFFKKNGSWQHITWTDDKGNPNKAAIDKEVADKINSI